MTKSLFLNVPELVSHATSSLPGAPQLTLLEEGRREKVGVLAFVLSWSSSPPSTRGFSTAAAPFPRIGTSGGRATSSLAHVEFFLPDVQVIGTADFRMRGRTG